MALEVTDVNISKVLEEKELTVLDFWAEWCGPCKMLGPVIDSLSLDEENKDITIYGDGIKMMNEINLETCNTTGLRQ